jgi:DNA-binding CsgD family transcriptional regulator/tetratricopeptide (TPR) repeat protein
MIRFDYPMSTATAQLPGPLRLHASYPFVGRSRELATLRTLVPRLPGEGRRIALIGGEAGSGKSRLVREFAREAAASGVFVLYGACDAVVRTPYRPFVEALEQLVRGSDAGALREDLGPAGGELARLLPELRARVEGLSEPVAAHADTERHRLHSVVGDLLTGAGRRRPLLLVLEDGHWADTPTLLLLRHLVRSATDARMLVVATFRDTEVDVPAELSDALADLRRADDVVRLKLGGLSEDEIAEFVERAAGREQDARVHELTSAIHALTQGNAFLVCELWRALLETGALVLNDGTVRLTRPIAEIATPESVREVVSQRVSRLDAATRDLLELAAVAGTEFELGVLQLAVPFGLERPDALEAAVRSGMVEEVPARTLAYRFTHELVRRALYDRLSALRRAELHLNVGNAIEIADAKSGRMLADLAHHFAAAAPLGDRERAITYNLLAAEAATAALAFEEAGSRLRTALDIGIEDRSRLAEAQLELGTAYFRAGASLDSLAAFRAAAEVARELGDGELLARAAIGFEDTCWRPGISDEGALELLEEASRELALADSPLRVRLLAGLARALDFQGDHARGSVVRDSAVSMARRLDDRHGLATTLMRSYWSRSATTLDEILSMLTEARDLAAELGDLELQAEAMEWRVAALMALGQIDTATRELAIVHELANRTRQPFIVHVAEHYGSALALLHGRLDAAEAAAERSREWGRLLTGRDASGIYGIQMFSVRREQGRLSEFAPVVRVLVGGGGGGGSWRPGLAALLAELGMVDEARRELERVRRDGLEPFRETLWLASLTYLADAGRAVDDAATAALVYPELLPLAGANVMIGHGVACYGSADRYLGMLSATLGRTGEAEERFLAAAELERRMGATTWLAHTAYEHGRTLLAVGEAERAAPLLAEAALLAESVGMPSLLARVRALGASPVRAHTLPDGLSEREVQVLGLIARGLSNREIGAQLYISEHTAANHVRSILRKTGCTNRTEAAAYAIGTGLAQGPT